MIVLEIIGLVSTFILGIVFGMTLGIWRKTNLPLRDCFIITINKLLDWLGIS